MPILSQFFGIYIRMFFNDHAPPHFHAEYQGERAVFNIETGDIMRGKISKIAQRLVEQWRKQHIEELNQAWKQAKNFRNPNKIKPLED